MSEVGDAANGIALALDRVDDALQALVYAGESAETVRRMYLAAFGDSSAIQEPLRSLDRVRDGFSDASRLLVDGQEALRTYVSNNLGTGPGSIDVGTGGKTQTSLRGTDLTVPLRSRDPTAKPSGEPEDESIGSPGTRAGHRLQNEAAKVLAVEGYLLRQLRADPAAQKRQPDYEINGKKFDCYSPDSATNVRRVRDAISRKVREQCNCLVVDLDRSGIQPAELLQELVRRPPSSGLEEMIIVHAGRVIPVWPPGRER